MSDPQVDLLGHSLQTHQIDGCRPPSSPPPLVDPKAPQTRRHVPTSDTCPMRPRPEIALLEVSLRCFGVHSVFTSEAQHNLLDDRHVGGGGIYETLPGPRSGRQIVEPSSGTVGATGGPKRRVWTDDAPRPVQQTCTREVERKCTRKRHCESCWGT